MLISHYDIGNLVSYEGILQGIDNSNFIVTTSKEKLILTIFESRIDPRDIPYFLGLMAHLSASEINCPSPLLTKTKKLSHLFAANPAPFFLFGWQRRKS